MICSLFLLKRILKSHKFYLLDFLCSQESVKIFTSDITIEKRKQKNEEIRITFRRKKEKIDNFFYYYKFHVLIGAFILFFVIIFIKDMVIKIDYDYSIAFLETMEYPPMTAWLSSSGLKNMERI